MNATVLEFQELGLAITTLGKCDIGQYLFQASFFFWGGGIPLPKNLQFPTLTAAKLCSNFFRPGHRHLTPLDFDKFFPISLLLHLE